MNRKGFTLIELLITIALLSIVLALVINYGSRVLGNAKKDLYVQDAREYLKAAKIELMKHSNRYPINDDDTTTTYYIHINNIPMETETGSPWGEWVDAYVIVTVDSQKNYHYGWTSIDEAGYAVDAVSEDQLSRKSIVIKSAETALSRPAMPGTSQVVLVDSGGEVEEIS